jgi:cystathionine gamma-synthase
VTLPTVTLPSVTAPTTSPATRAAQALGWIDPSTRAVTPPVHPASTFERAADNTYPDGRIYGRADSPAYDQVEALLASLEEGAASAVFASGTAAATAVFLAFRPGDHILVPKVMYWSLRKWLVTTAVEWGLDIELVEMSDLDSVRGALRPGKTRLVWIETPANPLWGVTDIAAVAALCRNAGARLVVDSTVATPVLTRPLALGADLVVHSATKYLNGHSDLLAGAVVTAARDDLWARVLANRVQIGAVLGAFESWLLLRGMRTLYPRVAWACSTAAHLAERLSRHPRIAAVLYPGLPDVPGHAVAARQMQGGFGGMLSIRVRGGEAAAIAMAGRLRIWHRATSLGGVESLAEHRASIEGPGSPVPGDLLRLSVGLEAAEDLAADLEQALGAAA